MNVDIVTKSDIEDLRLLISENITNLTRTESENSTHWIRSSEVQDLLNCSSGTLQNLRVKNILPYTKLGGTLYYDRSEIERILNENYNE